MSNNIADNRNAQSMQIILHGFGRPSRDWILISNGILLIHAQDTMMSIDSEYRMACRFISLYRKLNTTEENS